MTRVARGGRMRWRSRSALLAVTISTLLAFATVATSQTAVTPVSFTPEETKVLLDKVRRGSSAIANWKRSTPTSRSDET